MPSIHFPLLRKFSVLVLLLFLVPPLFGTSSSNQFDLSRMSEKTPVKSVDPNYCAPSGQISDACCDYETVEQINKNIYPRLHELIKTDFFKYYKLNLYKECPFWQENGQCINRACSVETTDNTDVPDLFKTDLGALQTSSFGTLFQPFKSCEFTDQDFCVVENEADVDGVFVNLQDNPERFTGYAGTSAGRVWKSIYEENCFNLVHKMDPSRNKILTPVSMSKNALSGLLSNSFEKSEPVENDDFCFEKRVYYRLISGLHSSISIHICDEYLNQTTGEWGPNLDCFISRVGSHPERIQNVYFNFVVLLRAISKISEYLKNYAFCTGGEKAEDLKVKNMLNELINTATSCPGTFDEKLMFTSKESPLLKEEFKARFRNVSRIMDCVGCDKCRLWGKLQISGIGTALKILFSYDDEYFNPKVTPNLLTRTEIVALFNTFYRFSESVKAIERFRELYRERVLSLQSLPTVVQNNEAPKKKTNSTNSTSQQPNNMAENRFFRSILSFKDTLIPCAKNLSIFIMQQLEYWHIPIPYGLKVAGA
ncbi:hypothetical protein G9A89_018541 [Geosiphon pyriformis]|nr:hypothetical protein G9A89_018541 [Geosiphon pyriformis]